MCQTIPGNFERPGMARQVTKTGYNMNHAELLLRRTLRSQILNAMLFLMPGCVDERIERPVPMIDTIQPATGIKGTVISIQGSGFSNNINDVGVYLKDAPADVILCDPHTILARIPPGATSGYVRVVIEDREATGPEFVYQESGAAADFAGTGFEGLDDNDTATSRFSFPWGAARDTQRNIYVADRGNHVIRKIDTEGNVSTVAGTGQPGYQDGPAVSAKFNDPVDVAVDASGNIFVSDFFNTCIRKITPAGEVSTYAGLAGAIGNANGTLSTARFFGPAGLTFDSGGNLFVADYFNHRIRKITPAGMVSTLAGSTAGCVNGTGGSAQFNAPVGLATDAADNIYVADGFNHSIRKVTAAGVVTRVAGTCMAGFNDGPPLSAAFDTPLGVELDENGDIIVSDSNNNRIRKIYSELNLVVTMAGNGTAGSANGIGNDVMLSGPADLVRVGGNEFLILDINNHKLRRITID